MKRFSLLLTLLLAFSSYANIDDNVDNRIRSSIFELESKLSKSLEDQVVQFVGIENLMLTVRINVSEEEIKNYLKDKKTVKASPKFFEDLPGLNVGTHGQAASDADNDKKGDSVKPVLDPALILSASEAIEITVYNKVKLDKKVERLIQSLIEEKLSTLKFNIKVSFNYRKAQVLDSSNIEDGRKIRFDPISFAKSFHGAVVLSFKEFVSKELLLPLKVGMGVVLTLFVGVFGLLGFFLFRGLSSINKSLTALVNSSKMHEAAMAKNFSTEEVEVDSSHDKTTTIQRDAVDLQQKILDIYSNYSEVISNFFMNAMDNKEFKDVWALTQVLGDKILLENKTICNNSNFQLYNKFLRNSMHLLISAEDYKRIYQKLMSLMLYPEVFFLNSIKSHIDAFTSDQIADNYETFTDLEKSIAIEVLDDLKLAKLVNRGLIKTEKFAKADTQSWDMKDLRLFDNKLTKITLHDESHKLHSVFSVIKYFSQEQFDNYILENNLDSKFCFADMFEAQSEAMEQFFKSLSADDICSVFSLLSDDIIEKICATLPELKLARVRGMTKSLNDKSFRLMAEMYSTLWTEEFKAEVIRRSSGSRSSLKAA